MIGILARWEDKVVCATAPTQPEAEEIVLRLFEAAGVELRGVQMEVVIFDPNKAGGMLISTEDEDPGQWTPEGWSPSE